MEVVWREKCHLGASLEKCPAKIGSVLTIIFRQLMNVLWFTDYIYMFSLSRLWVQKAVCNHWLYVTCFSMQVCVGVCVTVCARYSHTSLLVVSSLIHFSHLPFPTHSDLQSRDCLFQKGIRIKCTNKNISPSFFLSQTPLSLNDADNAKANAS